MASRRAANTRRDAFPRLQDGTQIGVTDAGKAQGRFQATGPQPKTLERLSIGGMVPPAGIFEEAMDVNL